MFRFTHLHPNPSTTVLVHPKGVVFGVLSSVELCDSPSLLKPVLMPPRPPEAGRQDAGGPLRTGKLIMSPGRLSTQVCWRTDLFCNISTWWLACLGSSISRDQQLTRS